MSSQAVVRTDERLVLTDRAAWRVVDGDVVAVDMETAEYLTMNGSGALIWDALARGTTETELADLVVDAYAISSQQAAADVAAFIGDLRQRELVAYVA
jgi:hypothetical protein